MEILGGLEAKVGLVLATASSVVRLVTLQESVLMHLRMVGFYVIDVDRVDIWQKSVQIPQWLGLQRVQSHALDVESAVTSVEIA